MSIAGSRFVVGLGAGVAAAVAYRLAVRPWMARWGATEGEANRSLPGDDLVPDPKLNWTHAVTIDAPTGAVWPWLVQIGQGRGGFYSYDWIENLGGLDIHSADGIVTDLQALKVGDRIPLAPDVPGIPVAILEDRRALVLHGDTREDDLRMGTRGDEYFNVVWGFHVDEIDPRTTRLIARWRADWDPSVKTAAFMRGFLEPGAFIMQRRMLLGIKERAERNAPHGVHRE